MPLHRATCIVARNLAISYDGAHESCMWRHLLQVQVKWGTPCCWRLATFLGIVVSRPGALCNLAPQRAPLSRRAVQVPPASG
jgi:hypothetical protein